MNHLIRCGLLLVLALGCMGMQPPQQRRPLPPTRPGTCPKIPEETRLNLDSDSGTSNDTAYNETGAEKAECGKDLCHNDYDCSTGQKCCSDGCRMDCLPAVLPASGCRFRSLKIREGQQLTLRKHVLRARCQCSSGAIICTKFWFVRG